MVNNRVTIQLIDTNKGYLDVKDGTNFPLSFSVAEIKDLTERKGTFSKSITLANTKNNAILLNKYFDINVIAGTFNVNKLQRCIVLEDNIPIVENAVMQLVGIKKVQKINAYDSEIEYTVLVKEATLDFFTKLGQLKLTDLTFPTFTHPYSASNIIGTFANTYLNTYKYIMPYSNDGNYSIQEWQPGIYALAYWNKIFEKSGFTYQWDEMLSDSIRFDKLIVPYNGDSNDLTQGQANELSVSATRASLTKTTVPVDGIGGVYTSNNSLGFPYIYTPDAINVEVSDPSNNYDPTTGTWTNPIYIGSGNGVNYKVSFNYTLEILNNSGADAYLVKDHTSLNQGKFRIHPYVGFFDNGNYNNMSGGMANVLSASTHPLGQIDIDEGAGPYPAGPTPLVIGSNTINVPNNANLQINDTLNIGFPVQTAPAYTSLNLKWRNGTTSAAPLADVVVRLVLTSITYDIVPTINNIGYLSNIDIRSYIPKDIAQSDFIKAFVTMYNLFIDIDPNEPNKLIIKTRDEYYDSGKLVDWTKKLNKDRDQNISWLAASQKKRLILTYKEDKDEPNTLYKAAINEVYGQQDFTYDNEYIKDTDKKEIIFSPTPITSTPFNAIVPVINGYAPKTNIRLLYDGGTYDCNAWNLYNYGTTGSTNLIKYPYFGHFDKPNNPNFDINFGTCDYYYYNTFGNKTNNNLYNYHWRRTLNQLNKGHMLTAYFNLNASDIAKMDLNDKIRIDNGFYNINQIIDYNPTIPGPTKVELISIDNELEFTPFKIRPTIGVGLSDTILNPIKDVGTGRNVFGSLASASGVINIGGTGNTSSSSSTGVLISGTRNTTATKGLVFGDDNIMNAKSLILGDNNIVESKSMILGDNNNVPVNLTNVLVVGDNINPTTDGIWADNINGIPTSSITNPDLATVLSNGNTTGPNPIILSTGGASPIRSVSGNSVISMDSGIVNTMLISQIAGSTSSNILFRPATFGVRIQTLNGSDSSNIIVSSTNTAHTSTDGTNMSQIILTATNYTINTGTIILQQVPATDNTNLNLLVRNPSTGNIELRDVSSLPSTGTQKYAATITLNAGNNTITHNLGTTDVQIQLKDTSGNLFIPNNVGSYTTNNLVVNVSSTVTNARVIVIG